MRRPKYNVEDRVKIIHNGSTYRTKGSEGEIIDIEPEDNGILYYVRLNGGDEFYYNERDIQKI